MNVWSECAALVYDVHPSQVTKDQREAVKQAGYEYLYSANKSVKELGVLVCLVGAKLNLLTDELVKRAEASDHPL